MPWGENDEIATRLTEQFAWELLLERWMLLKSAKSPSVCSQPQNQEQEHLWLLPLLFPSLLQMPYISKDGQEPHLQDYLGLQHHTVSLYSADCKGEH